MITVEKQFFDTLQLLRGLGICECEIDEIAFAYDIARHAHQTQMRDDGKEYISHPVEGCLMMARDFHVKEVSLYTAFLLHDVGEDTTIFGDRNTLPQWKFVAICTRRVSRLFGPLVAEIVVGMTKPGKIDGGWTTKDEMMEKYLEKLGRNYKTVLLKMMDRLHNLISLPPDDLKRIEKQVVETKYKLMPVFEKGIEEATKVGDLNNARSMMAMRSQIEARLLELDNTEKG